MNVTVPAAREKRVPRARIVPLALDVPDTMPTRGPKMASPTRVAALDATAFESASERPAPRPVTDVDDVPETTTANDRDARREPETIARGGVNEKTLTTRDPDPLRVEVDREAPADVPSTRPLPRETPVDDDIPAELATIMPN